MRFMKSLWVVVALLFVVGSAADASLYQIKQSSTAYPLIFIMTDSTGAAVTGLTPTVTLSKSGAAFGAAAGTVTEISNGWYKVAGNATDVGTLGPLALHATGGSALPTDAMYEVVAYDPQSATSLGLTNLDAAISSRAPSSLTTASIASAILTTPANLLNTDSSGRVLLQPTQTGVTIPTVTTVTGNVGGSVAGSVGSVTGSAGGIAGVSFPATVPSATGILDTLLSGHTAAGSVGLALQSAGSAGDPWSTTLPGSYAVGTGGYIIGHYIDALISSRLASTSYAAAPTASQIASAILQTPANLLKTDTSGNVTVGAYAAGQDPGTLVWAFTIDSTLTAKQMLAIGTSVVSGAYAVTRNTTNKTITVTYYRAGTSTVLATLVTNYSDSALTTAVSRTINYSNLP